MKKFYITQLFALTLLVLLPCAAWVDPLDDLSNVFEHSENIVVTQDEIEGKYSDEDLFYIQRQQVAEEWVTYRRDNSFSATITTYFWPGEPVSHFEFYASFDNQEYRQVFPEITTSPAVGEGWSKVLYSVVDVDQADRYLKIVYQNTEGVVWSPMLAEVEFGEFSGKIERTLKDIDDSPNKKAISVVTGLGFMNGRLGEFRPQNPLTRGELVDCLSSILKFAPTSHYMEDAHQEVPVDNAIRAILELLGYGKLIDQYEHITSVPAALSLVKGARLDYSKPITREQMAQIVYNALTVDMAQERLSLNGDILVIPGKTLLEGLGITVKQGIVFANQWTRITGEGKTTRGYIEFAGEMVDIGNTLANEFIGHRIEAYIQESTDGYHMMHFEDLSEIYEFLADDVDYVSQDEITLGKIRLRVSPDTRIIYNKRFQGKIADTEVVNMIPDTAFVSLIDNNRDGIYDIMNITHYQVYFTKTAVDISRTFGDYYGNAVEIDAEQAEYFYCSTDTVAPADSIIMIAKSHDGKLITAEVVKQSVTGDFEELGSDYIKVDQIEYKINPYAREKLQVGGRWIFYLDKHGRVTFGEPIDREWSYGAVLTAAIGERLGGISIKMYTADRGVEVLDLPAGFRINGERVGGQHVNLLTNGSRLVRYNRKGNSIETAKLNQPLGGLEFSMNKSGTGYYVAGNLNTIFGLYRVTPQTEIFMVPENRHHGEGYYKRSMDSLVSEKSYKVELYDINDQYEIGAMVIQDDGSTQKELNVLATVAVLDRATTVVDQDGDKRTKLHFYQNGVAVEKLLSKQKMVDTTTGLPLYTQPKFNKGDIFQYITVANSVVYNSAVKDEEQAEEVAEVEEIEGVRFLFTQDNLKSGLYYEMGFSVLGQFTADNCYSELYTAFGKVSKRLKDRLLIKGAYREDADVERVVPLVGGQVYVYQIASNRLRQATAEEIRINDDIVAVTVYGASKMVLIVRE